MKIKKNTIWMFLTLIILVIAGYFVVSSSNIESNSNISVVSGDVQVVKMYVSGANYIFEPSSVIKGRPVRIEADISRMPGCSKSVVSSELGIRKTFSSGDNSFTFTPSKAGTFYVACSMNMYTGNLIVLESDGTKTAYVQETPTTSGSTCGGSGGCGCGGIKWKKLK